MKFILKKSIYLILSVISFANLNLSAFEIMNKTGLTLSASLIPSTICGTIVPLEDLKSDEVRDIDTKKINEEKYSGIRLYLKNK